MTDNLKVDPADLIKASAGINGVINGLADTGVGSDYSAAIGRGHGDLDLDGRTIGHTDPKSGLEEYCDRWEWGVRALVPGAAEISKGLGLGASHYEREEKWAGDQLKNFTMDVIGDPSLTPEDLKTMSWGDLWEHNKNAITDPQWALTPEELRKHQELGEQLRGMVVENLETIGRHSVDPSSLVTDTLDGFERGGFTADSPAGAETEPTGTPETK